MFDKLPLGIKLIWFMHLMGVISTSFTAFNKPMPIIAGPWVLPQLASNFYIALIVMSQGYIVLYLPHMRKKAWYFLMLVEMLGIVLMITNLFITPEILKQIFEGSTIKITVTTYRMFLVFAISLQSLLLLYIYKKRPLFVN